LGRNVFIAIALIALYFDYLSHLPLLPEKIKVRFHPFFEKYFLIILLFAISLYSIGALNEKLFDNNPTIHSMYQGFTIGGIMPASDSAGYLIDIQSFLKYGVIQSAAVYRPIATMFAAVLYKCCGEDIIAYFYLTTVMLILAIFWLGRIVAYHFNKGLAIIASFCLCLYFALFQGSFMTEMTGGIVGLLAFAALLDSILRRNIMIFFSGLMLFGLAMQIRAGTIFILPLLVFWGAVYFRKKIWICTKTLLVGVTLVLLIPFSVSLQLSLFSQKIDSASNIGDLVYQIQVNSTDWRQVQLDFPERFNDLENFNRAKLSNEIAFQKFKNDPSTFFVNYTLKLLHIIKSPGLYTFHFIDKYLSEKAINIVFFLFLLTPFLYRRYSRMHVLFWFLLLGLVGSIFSSPILDVVRHRSYAASISFNVMIFAIAIANGFLFLKGFYYTASGLHWNFYFKRKMMWLRFKESRSRICKGNNIVPQTYKGTMIYIIIALIILVGPVITDKLRNYKPPRTTQMDLSLVQSKGWFLLSVHDSPHAVFDPQNDFVVNDPLVIPKAKLLNNKTIETIPGSRFYLFSAINHFDFMKYRQYYQFLEIPEVLLNSIKMNNISSMVLKGECIMEGKRKIFLTKEICEVTLKN
jgi:hypothetical protein